MAVVTGAALGSGLASSTCVESTSRGGTSQVPGASACSHSARSVISAEFTSPGQHPQRGHAIERAKKAPDDHQRDSRPPRGTRRSSRNRVALDVALELRPTHSRTDRSLRRFVSMRLGARPAGVKVEAYCLQLKHRAEIPNGFGPQRARVRRPRALGRVASMWRDGSGCRSAPPKGSAYWGSMLVKEALTFRVCQATDIIFIARLSGDAFIEYSSKAVSHTLDMVGRYTTWVAVRGSEAVGFVAINKEASGVAVLHAIAVVRRERGRGVGFRLMQLFERFAREQEATRLELCTAECNLAALDLFYRRGFRLERRRERFYERGQNGCVLVKDLEPLPPL